MILTNIFINSSSSTTGNENINTSTHSLISKGIIPNTSFMNGIYKITKCKIIENEIATINQGFNHTGIVNNELSSEMAFIALNISITTNTVKLKVHGFLLASEKYRQGLVDKSNPENELAVKSVHV